MKLPRIVFLLLVLSAVAFPQTFTSTTPYVCQAGPTEGFPITDPSTQHCQGIPYLDPNNPDIYHPLLQTFTLGGRTLVTGPGINWTDSAWVPFTITLNNETDQNCPLDPRPNSDEPPKTCGTFKFTAYPVDFSGVTHTMNFEGNWVNHHCYNCGLLGRWNDLEYTYSKTTLN